MTRKLGRVATAVVALLLGAQVYAGSGVATADGSFVVRAASNDLAEIRFGSLAIARGVDPQVKLFGRRVVDDYTRADNDLKKLAAKKRITLPTQLSAEDQAAYDKLSGLTGSEFDAAYLDLMTSRLHDAINDFETEAGTGEDSDVRRWAERNAIMLRAHHDLARDDR